MAPLKLCITLTYYENKYTKRERERERKREKCRKELLDLCTFARMWWHLLDGFSKRVAYIIHIHTHICNTYYVYSVLYTYIHSNYIRQQQSWRLGEEIGNNLVIIIIMLNPISRQRSNRANVYAHGWGIASCRNITLWLSPNGRPLVI